MNNFDTRIDRNVHGFTKKIPVLLIAGLLLAGCGGDKTDVEYLQLAQEAAQQGKQQEQLINLKNALQVNSDNVDARVALAMFYLSIQEGASAEKELRKAASLGAYRAEVTPLLVRALYYQAKFDELVSEAESSKDVSGEAYAEVNFYVGLAKLATKDVAGAEKHFANKTVNPLYNGLSSGYLSLLENDKQKALEQVKELADKFPDNVEVNILAGKVYASLNQYKSAASHFENAHKENPNRYKIILDLINTLILSESYDKADEYISKANTRFSHTAAADFLKARLELERRNWDAAHEYASKVLSVSNNHDAKLIDGIALFYLEQWELSHKMLEGVAADLEQGHPGLQILALVKEKLGYEKGAEALLDDILSSDKSLAEDAAISLSDKYLREGNYVDALKVLDKVGADQKDSANILSKKGAVKILAADEAAGLKDLQQALDKEPYSVPSRVLLARYYMSQGQVGKALDVISKLTESPDRHVANFIIPAYFHMSSERYLDAEAILKKAKEIYPDSADVYFFLSRNSRLLNKLDESIGYMEELNKKYPENIDAIIKLYDLYVLDGDKDKARSFVSQYTDNPKNDVFVLIKALVDISDSKFDAALTSLESISEQSVIFSRVQKLIGEVSLRSAQYERARKAYKKWMATNPKDPRPYLAIAKIHTLQGDDGSAISALREGVANIPDYAFLKLALIKVLYDSGAYDAAKQETKRYLASHGTDARIATIQGQLAEKSGNSQTALDFYLKSYEMQPSRLSLIKAATHLAKQDRVPEAIAMLDIWLNSHPSDEALAVLRVQLLLSKEENNQRAITEYSQLIERFPNNVTARNNLSWAYVAAEQYDLAVEHAEVAYSAQPDSVPVADTYGYSLLLAGEAEKAEAVLRKANAAQSDNASVALHLALALIEMDKKTEAVNLLQPFQNSESSVQADIEALLDRLGS